MWSILEILRSVRNTFVCICATDSATRAAQDEFKKGDTLFDEFCGFCLLEKKNSIEEEAITALQLCLFSV